MEHKTNDNVDPGSKIITIPNILSFFRICLIPLIVWLYIGVDRRRWTGYVLLLSGLTDIADGLIARRFHMTSNLGKVLDPIADKLTQGAMLICLLMRYPLMVWPLLLMVFKEIFMSVSGLLVIKRTGVVLDAHWHGKAATCLLYAMMFLHVFWSEIPPSVSNWSIAVCAGMILISFALYAARNLKILREADAQA